MLTRQGWLVAGGAAALIAIGRVLGLVELYVAGATAAALLGVCITYVAIARLDLGVRREVRPPRVHAGSPSRAHIELHNHRGSQSPVLRLRDPVSGTAGADLLVPPLRSGERVTVAYRLPTDRRGLVSVGPLDVVVNDPFGLASVRNRAAPELELTVFPRLDTITPPAQASGPDPTSGSDHPSALGRTGEEFYALRPYVMGDDLRRVHWPSTARTGELVVRQNELPWQGRVTVALDQRRGALSEAVFEDAVSAAASVLEASRRRGDLVRLILSDGTDSTFGSGHAHVEAIFEVLAAVSQSNRSDLSSALHLLERSGANGALVCLTGETRPSELQALARAAPGFARFTAVIFGRSAPEPLGRRIGVVHVSPGADFATAWQRSLSVRRYAVDA